MQALDNVGQFFGGHAHILGQFRNVLRLGGQELMQRRVQITDGHGTVAHDLVHGDEVGLLIRLDLGQSSLALLHGTGADHLAHSLDAVLGKEHMLGTAQTDALGAHIDGILRVGRVVGVGQDLELASLVGPAHETLEVGVLGGSNGRDLALVDVAGGAVDADPVAFLEFMAVDADGLGVVVNDNIVVVAAAGDAAGAHAAGNDGRVAGHAAADGQDALRDLHAHDVLGAGLQTDQNDLLPLGVLDLLLGVLGAEHNAAAGRSRRSSQALADGLSGLQRGGVELGMQQGVELLGLHAQHGFTLGDDALVHQVAGDLQGSLGGTLAVTGLQHEQLAVLDGELHILHIAVVALQTVGDSDELVVNVGHLLMQLADWGRSTDAGDDVLALGIDQVLAHQLLLAGGGVTGEGNAGAGTHTGVTEGHLLHVDGSAPLVGDLVHLAVDVGAGVVPGAENSLDGADELLFGVLRELAALLLAVDLLELLDEFLQIVGVQIDVLGHALALLHGVDALLKEALAQLHDDVGIHLDEAAVAVVSKAGVVGLFGQAFHGLVVQAQVQDGIHHAGHGLTGAGTDRNQQRVLDGTEGLAGLLFQDAHIFEDVGLDLLVDLTVVGIVLGAGFGGDGEALRDRHTGVGHLGQAGALATQNILHGGLVAAEGVMALFEQIQEFLAHTNLPKTVACFAAQRFRVCIVHYNRLQNEFPVDC